jgi:preprotein translocase subunit YajC
VNPSFLILILLVGAGLWLMIIRPQKRRQQAQQDLLDSVGPGAEIMTASGLYGTVRSVDGDAVKVEIAPGTEVRMTKRAIASVVSPDESGLDEIEQGKREAEEEVVLGRRDDH